MDRVKKIYLGDYYNQFLCVRRLLSGLSETQRYGQVNTRRRHQKKLTLLIYKQTRNMPTTT